MKRGRKPGFKHKAETIEKIKNSYRGSSPFVKGHKPYTLSKEKNGRWNGGTSVSSYSVDWSSTLRISIRERDMYTCKICFSKQGDMALDVHHIDYNKSNLHPSNLVTVCDSCHSRCNGNRTHWKAELQAIQSARGL